MVVTNISVLDVAIVTCSSLFCFQGGGDKRNTSVSLLLMSGVCHGEIITITVLENAADVL